MLGLAIAAQPVARDGLGLLGSDLGRTRLAEAALPAWGRVPATGAERDSGAIAPRETDAAATRP